MKKAVIYARVSDRKQVEKELSLPEQIEQGRRKAGTLGASVVREFTDGGISGTTDQRQAFLDCIEYCELFGVDYLITWSSSRFARNRYDAAMHKRRLDECGTKLIYVSIEIDRDTVSGQLFDGMLELFDEHKSIQTSVDTRRSMIRNAQQGYWNGGMPPYGYRISADQDNPKRKRIEPHPDEASLVRQIFKLRADECLGAKSIARWLNDRGETNRGARWNRTTIGYLLRNHKMIGKTIFGKKSRRTNRLRDRSDWIVVDSHAPIVPMELWDRVQALLDRDALNTASSAGSPLSTHLFTGLAKCGVCGAPMHIESAKGRARRYYYYNCSASAQHHVHSARRMRADILDPWLVDQIAEKIFTREALDELASDLQKAGSNWTSEHAARRTGVVKRLVDLRSRNSNLFEVLELQGIRAESGQDITARIRANNERMAELEKNLQTLDSEKPPVLDISPPALDELADFLLQTIKETTNPKKVRSFFAHFISEIRLGAETAEIEYIPSMLMRDMVPSTVKWLPGAAVLGTRVVVVDVPAQLRRAA